MPTLVLTPRYTDDTQVLWKAASRLGWSVHRLSSWRAPATDSVDDPVLYAEALFAADLAAGLGLQLLDPAEDWLVRLPREYRGREIRLMTLAEARRLAETPAFVKPPNDKSFPARVYLPQELPADYDDAMSVLVSDVVHWECEFRCFVLDRTLVTFSLYSRDGELQKDVDYAMTDDEADGVRAFLATLLRDPRVDLPRATVVDVGLIRGHGWACVEQNAAWGAGLYGCDPEAALSVIRHASRTA